MASSKILSGLGLILCLSCDLIAADISVISKADWEGQNADGDIDSLAVPVNKVIISHTASDFCNDRSSCDQKLRNIQKMQMDSLGFSDIAYNFLIGNDGNVYEGRGWSKVGAHTKGYNAGSVGLAFIGTFSRQAPTEAAIKVAQDFIAEGVRLGKISTSYKLFGHRQFSSTESPGDALYAIIKKWSHWARGIN